MTDQTMKNLLFLVLLLWVLAMIGITASAQAPSDKISIVRGNVDFPSMSFSPNGVGNSATQAIGIWWMPGGLAFGIDGATSWFIIPAGAGTSGVLYASGGISTQETITGASNLSLDGTAGVGRLESDSKVTGTEGEFSTQVLISGDLAIFSATANHMRIDEQVFIGTDPGRSFSGKGLFIGNNSGISELYVGNNTTNFGGLWWDSSTNVLNIWHEKDDAGSTIMSIQNASPEVTVDGGINADFFDLTPSYAMKDGVVWKENIRRADDVSIEIDPRNPGGRDSNPRVYLFTRTAESFHKDASGFIDRPERSANQQAQDYNRRQKAMRNQIGFIIEKLPLDSIGTDEEGNKRILFSRILQEKIAEYDTKLAELERRLVELESR